VSCVYRRRRMRRRRRRRRRIVGRRKMSHWRLTLYSWWLVRP